MAFQLLAQLSNNAKDLMTSGRGDTVTTPLTEENTHIISLGVEKGDRDLTEDTTNTNNDQSWRVTQKSLIRRHLFDLIALVVLLVIVAVLFVLLQVVRRDNGVSENNAITVDDSWFNSPPTSFETNIPVQAPTRAPIEPFEPSVFPPQIQSNTPTFPSINEQILKVFDESKIADPTTPLGRAYQWIQKEDDASPLQTYPTIVQRFVLAAFYFSTGGGRTSTTWSVCGAVPANPVQGGDGVALRCVFDTDDRTDVICAQPIDFLECPEYYEKYNVTRPKNPRKKRWLSESSECDWYGITCNAQGQVVQMSLPSNGLIGPLLEDLHILSEIRFLNLDDNNFAGALPDWENFHLIEDLMISNSKLEGMIPQGWKTWRRLKTLAISDNGMDGPLILPGDWSELDTIFAGDNNFDIAIRPKIGDLTGLRSLELGGNDLVSSIPRSIGQLTNLRLLDLSRGQMTGSLPSEIGQLTQLVELQLQDNRFGGTLPEELWLLSNLQTLRLGKNRISGRLSRKIGQLVNLVHLSVERTNLDQNIPQELGSLTLLEEVQLQLSSLSGEVPDDFCTISTLSDLRANCEGPGKVSCSCCSVCCNGDKGTCKGV